MNKLLLVIKADVNDADYVESRNYIKEDDLPFIKKVIKALKNSKDRHNWDVEGYDASISENYKGVLTEDEIDNFSGYVPYGGNESVHTIDEVTLYEITKETKLL